MKALRSTAEGIWTETVSVKRKGEVKAPAFLMFAQSGDEAGEQEKKASKKDTSLAQLIYDRHKPVTGEKDVYELIYASIRLSGVSYQGIINYRLNGGFKQERISGFELK